MISSYKFVLRPLSDLTKPCLEGGKVPIVELANLLGYYNLEPYDIDGEIQYGWTNQICDDYESYCFGWSNELKTFGIWYDCVDGNPIETICNLDAINWLYKHHFDINGLIEKGYAIDINTIKSE